jgi:hypothetical protein
MLGVLTAFIVQSLAGSFQITRDNRIALDASAATQRLVESVRGQWNSRTLFNQACAIVTLNPASSSSMTITARWANLPLTNSTTEPTLSYTALTTTGCATPGSLPACTTSMRRVLVIASSVATPVRELSRATLDLPCPGNP